MTIRPLTARDINAWLPLWQGYLDFYRARLPEAVTQGVWARLSDGGDAQMQALGAYAAAGELQGFVHVVFHPNTWSLQPCCYLEDLFVAESARGQGLGRALIDAVYALAQARGCGRVYWVTDTGNHAAQGLYHQVAAPAGVVQFRKDFD